MQIKRLGGGTALFISLLLSITGARESFGASIDSGRAAYLLGKRARTADERRGLYQHGIKLSRHRLTSSPDDPEALLWLAANLGAEALERGKLSALNVLPEMERLLLRLDAVAPTHDHAAAARTLGRLYHKAPAFISIGSMKRARQYWEKALQLAGDAPANLILAADFFAADGDRTRARALAARYLERPATDAENPDAGEWLEIARKITGQKP